MKKVLHILKNSHDDYALDLIKRETGLNQVSLLLIQDAAGMSLRGISGKIYVLGEDLKEGELTVYPKIDYREMLKMIFENETVITW